MIKQRLTALRQEMQKRGIAAVLVPSTDAHQSEYLPGLWQRRPWISGFDGSAGDVIITTNKAALWTDGRYFVQAEQQLAGSGIELMRMGEKETPSMTAFLQDTLQAGDTVAVDPKTVSHNQAQKIQKELQQAGLKISFPEENLVDLVWDDQPGLPDAPLRVHPQKYAGETHGSKLQRLRKAMAKKGADAHVITMLDAVAWLFNLRGADVDFNPVFIAYAIVEKETARLFVLQSKVTDEVRSHLGDAVQIHDYSTFKTQLQEMSQRCNTVWIDAATTNHWIAQKLEENCRIVDAASPVLAFKAIKNDAEQEGLRKCHIRDGAAMVAFLAWLEEAVPKGGVTELSATLELERFRRKQPLFIGPSFSSISSYKTHGGIIHYSVDEESDIPLEADSIYLIDSGGQYEDGTTDITRTVALGTPTAAQKEQFTRVLMGHIDLNLASFPVGTNGPALDTITRQPLWEIGLNFKHGTGHGVGAALCVHEGPASINPAKGQGVAVEEGMVFSNEPGYYKDGEYGIRVENLVIVKKDEQRSSAEFPFLKFENITWCPIDLRLVDKNLLSKKQLQWLNSYHETVREKLSPLLSADLQEWLQNATRKI